MTYNISKYNKAKSLTVAKRHVAIPCRCSLGFTPDKNGKKIPLTPTNGQERWKGQGYCGSVLGTQKYKDALEAIKPVLEASKCHTLDRHNWEA